MSIGLLSFQCTCCPAKSRNTTTIKVFSRFRWKKDLMYSRAYFLSYIFVCFAAWFSLSMIALSLPHFLLFDCPFLTYNVELVYFANNRFFVSCIASLISFIIVYIVCMFNKLCVKFKDLTLIWDYAYYAYL